MKISIVGAGYVGIVTGACLAANGHDIICVDIDENKVDTINAGKAPIYENGLDELLTAHAGKNLRATTDLKEAVMDSELTLIAVGTPFDGTVIDLKYVKEVARQIGQVLKNKDDYHVVVVKSTVVPGTTNTVVLPLLEEESGKVAGDDFGVGMNPEFLAEGRAIIDFMKPDRIVVGGIDDRSQEVLGRVYEMFTETPIVKTNNETAEMIKYASNSVLATAISFSNEIANLCSALGGIDASEVMKGVHLMYRLSPFTEDGGRIRAPFASFLEPGCGFGGSCLPKDVKALVAHGKAANVKMQLLESVININRDQPMQMIKLLKKYFPTLEGLNITVLGLAFKPETDDMRESPSVPIILELISQGAKVKAHDPIAIHEAKKVLNGHPVHYTEDLNEVLKGADAVVLVTSWDHYKKVPEMLEKMGLEPVLIDGRRMLEKDSVANYDGIGL